MLKIGNMEQIKNEKVNIEVIVNKSYKTLHITVSGDDCLLNITLNISLEKLLELPLNETIDFNDYISDFWVGKYDSNYNSKIVRYLKNRYILSIIFYEDDFMGMTDIDFNLDDYLK